MNNMNPDNFSDSELSDDSIVSESIDDNHSIDDYIDEAFKGEILNNKYLLINQIGHGSFATVWLSLNLQTSKYHAIKIQNYEDYESGIEEVDLFKKFSKNNCIYINNLIEHFEYKIDDDIHVCMVFELLAGSLYDIIKCGKYSNGLPLNIIKLIIYQLLNAMDIINNKHKILHTDIKPENILVCGVNNKHKDMITFIQKNKPLIDLIHKKKN